MQNIYYQLYWVGKEEVKVYHMDKQFDKPWRFYSYQELYSTAERLTPPSIEHRTFFEQIKN